MRTNLGGRFIDGLGNSFGPAKRIDMSDGTMSTPRNPDALPLVTATFQDTNSMSVGWEIGTYGMAYCIQQYCTSEGNSAAPKMQIAYMLGNNKVMYRYTLGAWGNTWKELVTGVKGSSESSYRTGDVSISKANIGLSAVVNERQYSMNNPQVLQTIWTGSTISLPISTFSSCPDQSLVFVVCGLNATSGYRDYIPFIASDLKTKTNTESHFSVVTRNTNNTTPDISGYEISISGSNLILTDRVRWVWSGIDASHTITRYSTPARNFLYVYCLK